MVIVIMPSIQVLKPYSKTLSSTRSCSCQVLGLALAFVLTTPLATLCIEHIFSCPVWRALRLLRLCVGGKLLLQVLRPALLCVFATQCAGGIRCTDSHAFRILSRCLLNAVPAAFGLLRCFSLHSNPLESHVRFLLLHCFAFCVSTSLLP